MGTRKTHRLCNFFLVCASLLYPFIWAFYNSMKTMDEYRDNTFSLPDRFNLTNYAEAFRSFKISTSDGEKWGWSVCF